MSVNSFVDRSSNAWVDSDANAWGSSVSYAFIGASFEETYSLAYPIQTTYELIYSAPYAFIGASFEETYSFFYTIQTTYELIYSAQIATYFSIPYGDVPKITKAVFEYYTESVILSLRVVLSYGEGRNVGTSCICDWDILSNPLTVYTELYSITEFGVVNAVNETYDLSLNNFIVTAKALPYYLLDESTTVSSAITSTVVYPGSANVDPSLSPGDPGYPEPLELDFISITIDAGLGQYCIACDIILPNADQYIQCGYLDTIEVTMGGTDFVFFIESRDRTVSNDAVSYKIGLLSPTAQLDTPYSKAIVASLDDGVGARSIVEAMASFKDITVDWQILDWFIPGYAISISDETPLAVIRKVVNAVGAIVQTKPNGDMLIISKYPNAVPTWAGLTPSVTYSVQLDINSLSETLKVNDGYNAFQITDQGSSSESITLDVVDIDGLTKYVNGYRVPFDDGPFLLETSGNPDISIQRNIYPIEVQMPIVEEEDDPEWEIIEFIDHTGTTEKPIYNVVDYDWIEDDLGAFQISEDGTLSIIDTSTVPSESLLRIKYITKYWQWTVSGPTDRPVQFYVPEIEEVS